MPHKAVSSYSAPVRSNCACAIAQANTAAARYL